MLAHKGVALRDIEADVLWEPQFHIGDMLLGPKGF